MPAWGPLGFRQLHYQLLIVANLHILKDISVYGLSLSSLVLAHLVLNSPLRGVNYTFDLGSSPSHLSTLAGVRRQACSSQTPGLLLR